MKKKMDDNGDDDIEFLYYTPAPLKRKKMGDELINNSPLTYSAVASKIHSKCASHSQRQSKRKLSQRSQKSKLIKSSQPVETSNSPPISFKKPLNYKSKASQNNKKKIDKTACEESTTTERINHNDNKHNMLDDDIPDIDLMQSIETTPDSKLQASSDNFNLKEDLVTEKNTCDIEFVVQTDLDKVDSWLLNSVEQKYISPRKIEVVEEPDDNMQKNRIPDSVNVENSPKTCVHLHFQVNSPQKFIQPTLEHFFTKSASCINNIKPGVKLKNEDSFNSKEVLKSWQNIMKPPDRNLAGPSGNIQISKNLEKETEATQKYKKKCPFYKFIEDTNFVVDGFNYGHIEGVTKYFLSHFHYDHYIGLSKNFKRTIYCSQITANLVRLKLNVEERFIKPLPLEESRVIDGVEVTLYDANHCPGAVMFLFKLTSGKVILHVGDFRAHPDMESISAFWNRSINVLYLDTTYLDPCYDFLSQEDILEKCENIAEEHTKFTKNTLFVVGSYTIGKEKVFKSISSKLDCKIYAEPYKERILRCLNDPEINSRLTKNKSRAQVHVIRMHDMSIYKLKRYMEDMRNYFKVLVAVKPTGWEHNSIDGLDLTELKPKQIGNIYVYGLPYSEHSSYSELRRFVQFIQPDKTIPTVNNGKEHVRKKMERTLKGWVGESVSVFTKGT